MTTFVVFHRGRQLIEAQRREAEEQQRHRQEVIARHRETRMRVIDEIVTTESDFLRSISLCHDVFVADTTTPRVSLTTAYVPV